MLSNSAAIVGSGGVERAALIVFSRLRILPPIRLAISFTFSSFGCSAIGFSFSSIGLGSTFACFGGVPLREIGFLNALRSGSALKDSLNL
jgi:hypothetical protein